MPTPVTTVDFLHFVRQSGLVDPIRLDRFEQKWPSEPADDPKTIANRMIEAGLITHLQAKLLKQGKTKNFLICGKYKLLEHIGAGGMGQVFLCEHVKMNRRVAIKVLHGERADDPIYLKRFYREAQAVAALDHPNIVRAHDMDHDGPVHLLVMEYVEGSNLQMIVKRKGPLSVERAVDYVVQAACGLQHAHEAGLIHRDVKPSNLLLDRTGQIKILDLGLARFSYGGEPLTQQIPHRSVIGTADFLAPEQAELSHAADARSDMYGLGATFYYLLAGHAPFQGGDIARKIHLHRTGQATPIEQLRPDIPAELSSILERAMEKDPAKRFQCGFDLIDALAPFMPRELPPPAEDEMPTLCLAARSVEPPSGRMRLSDRLMTKARLTPASTPTSQLRPKPSIWPKFGLALALIVGGMAAGTIIGKLIVPFLGGS